MFFSPRLQVPWRWRPVRPIQYGKIPDFDTHKEEGDTPTPGLSTERIAGAWNLAIWNTLVFLVGIGAGIAFTILLLTGISVEPCNKRPAAGDGHFTSSPPGVIPPEVFYPKIPTSWTPDERYIGFSKYSNLMWHRLVRTTESVWISNPAQHGLGRGFDPPGSQHINHTTASVHQPLVRSQFYHISNLHQLHCLNILRGRYFELQLDLPGTLSKQSETAARDTAYHVDHCIEYLRMSIICGGSWEVEGDSPDGTPPELRTDPFGHPIGWGGIRLCVNWEALMDWQRRQMGEYRKLAGGGE